MKLHEYPNLIHIAPTRLENAYGMMRGLEWQIWRKGPVTTRKNTGSHMNQLSTTGSSVMLPDMAWDGVPDTTGIQLDGAKISNQYVHLNHSDMYDRLGMVTDRAYAYPGRPALSGNTAIDAAGSTGASVLASYLHDGTTARDVDYVRVDSTNHYQVNVNVTSLIRQYVYFRPTNPDTDNFQIVMFDRIVQPNPRNYTAGTGTYGKLIKWNCSTEPTFLDGTVSAGPNRGPTGTDGKTQS